MSIILFDQVETHFSVSSQDKEKASPHKKALKW